MSDQVNAFTFKVSHVGCVKNFEASPFKGEDLHVNTDVENPLTVDQHVLNSKFVTVMVHLCYASYNIILSMSLTCTVTRDSYFVLSSWLTMTATKSSS